MQINVGVEATVWRRCLEGVESGWWFSKREKKQTSRREKDEDQSESRQSAAYFYQKTQHQALTPAGVSELPQEAILGLPHPGCQPILTGISADKQAWAVLGVVLWVELWTVLGIMLWAVLWVVLWAVLWAALYSCGHARLATSSFSPEFLFTHYGGLCFFPSVCF